MTGNSGKLKITGSWEDAIGKAIKADPSKLPKREQKPRKKKPSGEKPKG